MLKQTSTQQSKLWQIAAITPTGLPAPVSETLPKATQRIVEGLQPEKIILLRRKRTRLGSYGTPTPDSDVDLLVVMNTTATTTERYLSVCRLLRPRPFPVDILVKTPQEIRGAFEEGDFFIQEIVSQGRVLYEQKQ